MAQVCYKSIGADAALAACCLLLAISPLLLLAVLLLAELLLAELQILLNCLAAQVVVWQ
jgi:hypothetical protein